jgi:hypothetical protein
MPRVHRELPAQPGIPKRTRADSKSHAETRFAPTCSHPCSHRSPHRSRASASPRGLWARLESPDTQNAARPKVRLRPTACPTGLESPMAKPKRAGIIIRVSGVRVPPPAWRKACKYAPSEYCRLGILGNGPPKCPEIEYCDVVSSRAGSSAVAAPRTPRRVVAGCIQARESPPARTRHARSLDRVVDPSSLLLHPRRERRWKADGVQRTPTCRPTELGVHASDTALSATVARC